MLPLSIAVAAPLLYEGIPPEGLARALSSREDEQVVLLTFCPGART